MKNKCNCVYIKDGLYRSDFSEFIVIEFYDGCMHCLAKCKKCGRWYLCIAVAWDPDKHIRVFAFNPLNKEKQNRIFAFIFEKDNKLFAPGLSTNGQFKEELVRVLSETHNCYIASCRNIEDQVYNSYIKVSLTNSKRINKLRMIEKLANPNSRIKETIFKIACPCQKIDP